MKGNPQKSWLSDEGKIIDENILLKLYEIYSEDEVSHLDYHYKYRNYYTTILSALLAIFVGGVLQFYEQPFAPALFALLPCIFILSELGKRTVNRYYRRFLESIVILSKIDHVLGLERSIKTLRSSYTKILWPHDEHFLPERWIQDREKHKNSEDFISQRMNMGDNRYAHWTFSFFEIASAILAICSVPVLLKDHNPEAPRCFIPLLLFASLMLVASYCLYRMARTP